MLHNADPAELAKFSNHEQDWWNPQGVLKSLHDINPLRLQWITSNIDLAGLQVLDVGCGGGILTEAMAQHGAKEVLGVDLASGALLAAQQHAQQQQLTNLQYQEIAVERLAQQQPQSFDVVTCMEMLEHVPDPLSIVQACAELVKPNGWVFLSTINRNLKAQLLVVYAAEYLLNMVPRGTHQADKFIKPSELADICRYSDLQPVQTKGLAYHLLSDSYSLTDDISMNYMLATRKFT